MTTALAVLASGRGSNFVAIADAIDAGSLAAEIRVLISDRKNAPALALAAERKIPTIHISYDRKDRETFERKAAALIEEKECDLVVLAGFMRLLTPYLVNEFAGRMINIHPSLLPSFKGLDAQQQAVDYGVRISGCTVHLVTENMDAGPIIAQRSVPVLEADTGETLSARILKQEHLLYPESIKIWADKFRAASGKCEEKVN